MLTNTQYRKLIIDSFYRMLSTQMAYGHVAMDICLLDELNMLDGYMEGENFDPAVFETIKDEGVRRIHRFLKETRPIIEAMEETNHFMDEELDMDDPSMPAYDGKADRQIMLCVLLIYTQQEVIELATLINNICELTGYPPITDYANAEFYEDENVRLISLFYKKVLELFEEFKEEVLRVDDERRGKNG